MNVLFYHYLEDQDYSEGTTEDTVIQQGGKVDITEEVTDEEEEETEEITTQVTTTINIVEFEKKMKNKKRIFTYFPFPKSHAEAQMYCENVGEKVASSLQ